MMTCRSDWMKLNCGDYVRELDGCHIGRVEAINSSSTVKVRWIDNGWTSSFFLEELVKIKASDLT